MTLTPVTLTPAIQIPDNASLLEAQDISVAFNPQAEPVLRDISLRICGARRIAIVGHSGSGKSTLLRCLAGSLPICAGDLQRATSVALVEQEACLFDTSVRDNIRLWDASMPEIDMLRAAKDACLHELVSARTAGYDTAVGAQGGNFSGGERQRIALARALARNPALLLLDDATAALDPVTEAQIFMHLRERGCACIVVTQRLASVRDFDEILVLEAGRILERGTHESLSAAQGAYARLLAED